MLPQDPVMLMSYLNTKLRDEYDSLEEFCRATDLPEEDLKEKLEQAGFAYRKEQNRIIRVSAG